ncbi:mitochondrial ribosomal protein L13 precursor [Cyanidioschyzon merolae strain 10D]|jgi:large subunit ribosomal protein L13|uniref:Mitochondrial ribosomal protein L13 n=1 Tax=Cyanidioschyzon merolae (strain NIES-3377 / 10D) TaxID=280699 RepID=M1UQS4_CYAM1|nr:mitochondrial ribosomal protein L13 precursor [Cyanidioschyzon merolae strain 10D]BAM79876.1 mitochondrial ribosomal protein L13 precursor [Cyanidioschyzon merolae strain 10D]|eukprot:XP_005536162.1 mitochondrial ribosomal protein L13 precursor [Cyanidioschyzon merolae strain 10D]
MGRGSLYTARFAAIKRIVEEDRCWRLFDARDQVLGRLASRVACILLGKHKPYALPYVNPQPGDGVIVINARHVGLTGKKLDQKLYRHHTGYPGGLKSELARSLLARKPERVIELAVRRMLPPDRRRRNLVRDLLRVYPDEKHPFPEEQLVHMGLVWRRVGEGGIADDTDEERYRAQFEFEWNRLVLLASPERVREILREEFAASRVIERKEVAEQSNERDEDAFSS